MQEPVTVALTYAVEERDVERLRRVSPRVRVLPIAHLTRKEYVLLSEGEGGGEEYRRVKEELDSALAQAEVLLLWREPEGPGAADSSGEVGAAHGGGGG